MSHLLAAAEALLGHDVHLSGCKLRIPGSTTIRLSTVLGNWRIHRLMDPYLVPGAVVVDVGANIGVNTVYAARRVGPQGRVVAIEPTNDNLAVLRGNVARNTLANVTIAPVAAGRAREDRRFYVRGDISAVNSFYEESVYANVTRVVTVSVVPLDDLVEGNADLVKIDVEGAELDVLAGMTRLLESSRLRLVVEWHPLLQEQAGHEASALPVALLEAGFSLTAAAHTSTTPLQRGDVARWVDRLRASGRPVDLLATRMA